MSTVFIKQPLNYRQSLAVIRQKYEEFSPILTAIMWMISGMYAAARSSINTNITGVSLAFPVYQLILMSSASFLLCKGLKTRRILYLLPWLLISIYTLYGNHYVGLIETLTTLKGVKKLSWLPWTNLSISILLMVIRGTLTVRMFQLCLQLWVRNKINQMKEL